jgi:hypothetical protein
MDSDFLIEVAAGAVCGFLWLVGRAILAHPISRRWNPDWDGFFTEVPFYMLVWASLSVGLFGDLALMPGFLLGTLPHLIWRLSGRHTLDPYNEPLPPLPSGLRPHSSRRSDGELPRRDA